MIDIEAKVAETLRADADRVVRVGGIRDGALARAAAIRRRRRLLGAVAGAGVVAVVTAGVMAAPRLMHAGGTPVSDPGPARVGADTPTRLTSAPGPTTLPEVTDVPPAADRPRAVGTDPAVLHFDVNLAALNADVSDWTSAKGYERVAILADSGKPRIEIVIGQDAAAVEAAKGPPGWMLSNGDRVAVSPREEGAREPVTVGGRPGTLQKAVAVYGSPERLEENTSWILRWQPADGLYALVQVFGTDPAPASAAADAIRFDHAQRCVVPLRLADVPAGATWTACRTSVRRTPLAERGVWVLSEVVVEQAGGRVSVWAEDARRTRHASDAAQFVPNRTVAGHPAQWRADDPKGLWLLGFGPAEVFVGGAGEADAVRLVEGLTVSGDLARVETWPRRAIG